MTKNKEIAENKIILRQEMLADREAIYQLHVNRLGSGRFAKASYRVREQADFDINHSWVILHDGRLIASVRQTWVKIDPSHTCLFLGPLVVEEEVANMGFGIRLLTAAIASATKAKAHAVILVGDAPYYRRVGFEIARGLGHDITLPGPADIQRILIHPINLSAEDKLCGQVKGIAPPDKFD